MARKEKRNVFKRILKRKGIYLPEDRFVGLNGLRLYEYEIIDLSLFSKLRGCYILNQLGEFYIVKMDKHKKLVLIDDIDASTLNNKHKLLHSVAHFPLGSKANLFHHRHHFPNRILAF